MLLAQLSADFQFLPPLPTIKLGPFGADSPGGWACICSRTLWVSSTNSPVRLGVALADAWTPTGVFSEWFEALFPRAGALGCAVCFAPHLFLRVYLHENVGPPTPPVPPCFICQLLPYWPAAALPAPLHNLPPLWVHQLSCYESSLPSCSSPPLLPVWMNVSSLTPWLLDFHTVRFSVSSGCFLFLNCCCPSFGCARRHSVSTYASILPGSPLKEDVLKLFWTLVHLFLNLGWNTC